MIIGRRYRKKPKNKIKIIFTLILILGIIMLGMELFYKNKKTKNNDLLIQDIIEDTSKVELEVKTQRMVKLEKLQEENPEICAWLEIEGSNINYPVLQTTDNSFYMTHNYKKESSKDGALFLDKDYDWTIPSTNLLIYGHNNIGSNEMFSELINYKDEDYYNNHKIIRFTTNQEDAEYEIIAVFLSRVYYKSETNVFRYYYFINAQNEEEFNEYIENSKKTSIYDTGITAEYGDQLLTLSTCEYSQNDGRLAVVARKK